MAEKKWKLKVGYCPETKRFELEGDSAALSPLLFAFLKEQAEKTGGVAHLSVELKAYKDTRSLSQNRMMWALLDIMAKHMGVPAMDCYIDMLSDFGQEFDYYEIPARALRMLQEQVRVCKVVDIRPGGERLLVKVYAGSSQFDTAQMTEFIERIFDRLSELGCDDPQMMTLWQEYGR